MIRVLLVDDQDMIRIGLRTILESRPELTVVAEAGDGAAALRVLGVTEVDVMVLDLRMPGVDGVETVRRLRRDRPDLPVRVLILTTFEQDENVLAALRAGADGFLGKGASPDELTAAVIDVAAGGHALSAAAMGALVGHVATDSVPVDADMARRFAELTPRERQIVQAIVSGMDNAAIAATLFLSPFTVKTHANRAMTKVGAHDRAQLVTFAVRAGLRP